MLPLILIDQSVVEREFYNEAICHVLLIKYADCEEEIVFSWEFELNKPCVLS